jgi:hypothetical protein
MIYSPMRETRLVASETRKYVLKCVKNQFV